MPNPNAVVSTVVRVEPSERAAAEARAGVGIGVELEGGRRVRLDPADERSPALARVLESLSQRRKAVYLEVDPETSVVTRVLIPKATRVQSIRREDDGISVELEMSHARHVLKPGSPDFAELERRLRDAMSSGSPVFVTENDAHEIIDVRPYVPGPEGPPFPEPRLPPRLRWRGLIRELLDRLWFWPWWPWWWFRCMPMWKAQQVFDAMKATSCDPMTVPAPCIPFLYPDDGCWGRAHEMCRLMINMGVKPRKVWIQGNLHVDTRNNPNCFVNWGWHVAPTVCVRLKWFYKREMVIDPSLFETPVSQATWKNKQGDPNATLTPSSASIFYLWGNVTDPTYTATNQVLADYRDELQLRSIQFGPPPYANCP